MLLKYKKAEVISLKKTDPFYLYAVKIKTPFQNFNRMLGSIFPNIFDKYTFHPYIDILNKLLNNGVSKNDIVELFNDLYTISNYVAKSFEQIKFDDQKQFNFKSKILKNYFSKSAMIGETVYRGINLNTDDIRGDVNRDIFKNVSFSKHLYIAKEFSKGRHIISAIVTKSNLLADLTEFYEEGEVLLRLKKDEFNIIK